MERCAFKMKLYPGFREEYRKRHDEVWPELARALHEAGVSDYSIYYDEETNILFAFQKLACREKSDRLPQNEAVQKWWAYMADIMETNPDHSPAQKELIEVFHMD